MKEVFGVADADQDRRGNDAEEEALGDRTTGKARR